MTVCSNKIIHMIQIVHADDESSFCCCFPFSVFSTFSVATPTWVPMDAAEWLRLVNSRNDKCREPYELRSLGNAQDLL